jgi:hypothetical protein
VLHALTKNYICTCTLSHPEDGSSVYLRNVFYVTHIRDAKTQQQNQHQ